MRLFIYSWQDSNVVPEFWKDRSILFPNQVTFLSPRWSWVFGGHSSTEYILLRHLHSPGRASQESKTTFPISLIQMQAHLEYDINKARFFPSYGIYATNEHNFLNVADSFRPLSIIFHTTFLECKTDSLDVFQSTPCRPILEHVLCKSCHISTFLNW